MSNSTDLRAGNAFYLIALVLFLKALYHFSMVMIGLLLYAAKCIYGFFYNLLHELTAKE